MWISLWFRRSPFYIGARRWWPGDNLLLFLLFLLSILGLLTLYSASGQNPMVLRRQMVFLVFGFVLLGLTAFLSWRSIRRWTPWIYLLGIGLLIAVYFWGVSSKGAQRWLDLPFLPRFQPSEMMKWVTPLMLAAYLSQHPLPPRPTHIFFSLALLSLPVMLVLLQPDLGTAAILSISGFALLVFAGLSSRFLAYMLLTLIASLPMFWFFVFQEYQKERVLVLFNPDRDPFGSGWSIFQSKAAIGSGGLYGKGWLQGTQSHLDFLPEGDTDFIIAALAEEWGFLGILTLLLLYLAIVWRGFWLSLQAPDCFGRMFAAALTLTFALTILVNMAMVTGLLPVVGLPLPLISRGGSSAMAFLIGFGLIMSLCTNRESSR